MIDKEKLLARRKKNKEQNDDKTLKRVYCLYRVSNKNQVDDDDIPMQKKACHEFASKQNNWLIEKEFYEKGVSGFSVNADDRDEIIKLIEAAARQEFDVLLVFMFDRLGRREDESPFILKWFVEQGIEVWSVKEGQQTFEKHEDDLINFIRFWAANAESTKTSQRVATRLRQMVEDGLFIGGTLPFGYKWIDTGNINKKGSMIRKPEIISEEAEIVRCIFHKTVNDGMKPVSLANQINEK
ncbi:MAG: recombinase family protein, partial [Ruminococcus sp.]|nr:recombinase family protein [Ruminococcus sp.]